MVITLCLDVGVRHQKDGQDDRDDVPARKYKTKEKIILITATPRRCVGTHVKAFATSPIFSGAYQAENATMAGIWSKQTCRA